MVHLLGLLTASGCSWALTGTPSTHLFRASVVLQLSRQQEWQAGPKSAGAGSSYPKWPDSAIAGRRALSTVLTSFVHVVTAVPVEAASEADCQWEAWLDGGFEAHKFIHKSISRQSYPEVVECLHTVLMRCREAYPDLWAVLKFVPKKNGLSPVLALLAREGADAVSDATLTLTPRAMRRQLDDLPRAGWKEPPLHTLM